MMLGDDEHAPRWGGVSQGSDTRSLGNPQYLRAFKINALQVRARSSVNVPGTCRKSGTQLTQPVRGVFS